MSANSPALLSFEEETKRRLHPLEALPRLLDCVSLNRPPDVGDRFRFEWFGLFYQAPAQDAFCLRVRVPGGRLRPFQLAGLAEITQQFAGGQVVLNAGGGLDVPGVPITSAVEILTEVEGIGLSARHTGGDCVRTVCGGEYDLVGGNHAPAYPLVCALEQAVARGPAFSDLPRPCEIVFQAAGEIDAVRDRSCDTLVLREMTDRSIPHGDALGHPAQANFLLILPGETESGYLLAASAVVASCLSLLKNWAATADRTSRENAGLANFLSGLEADALHTLLGGAKRVPLPAKPGPGIRPPAVGCAVPAARLLSAQLAALERCCREQGWREVRLARGHLYAIGTDGKWEEEAVALARALSS